MPTGERVRAMIYATAPGSLPDDIRHKLLLAKLAFVAGDHDEAYHWLYAIACPGFDCNDPWAAIEGRECQCSTRPHRLMVVEPPTVEELDDVLRDGVGKSEVQK